MSDPLRELIRKQIRAMLAEEVSKTAREIIAEEVAAMVQGQIPLALASPAPTNHQGDKPRRNTLHAHRHPRGTLVRVNKQYVGAPATHGTQLWTVWQTAIQHLGEGELERVQLHDDIVTILGKLPRSSVSSQLTALLDRGCLLGRLPGEPVHAIGDTWRHTERRVNGAGKH